MPKQTKNCKQTKKGEQKFKKYPTTNYTNCCGKSGLSDGFVSIKVHSLSRMHQLSEKEGHGMSNLVQKENGVYLRERKCYISTLLDFKILQSQQLKNK